jgi:hypothetical protein
MEKEFVPYTESLELKELGFDEPCFAFYRFGKEFYIKGQYKNTELAPVIGPTVPTFSQAFRFFREKYGLKGEVDIVDTFWSKWSFKIELKGSTYILYSGLTEKIYFNSYEEAELACLVKLIQIIKEKL